MDAEQCQMKRFKIKKYDSQKRWMEDGAKVK